MEKKSQEQTPSTSVQYASDLHLEFPQNKQFLKANSLVPKGEILLLAGDIVPFAVMEKHTDFFDYISDHFRESYWVPGNHEYYYFDAAKKSGVLNERIRRNVHLVNNITIDSNGTRFIFSTLWSKISPAYQWEIERGMTDFQVIKYKNFRFSVEQYNHLHEESRNFIETELQKSSLGKTVVVTHHVPTFMNYPPQYKGDVLNEAFATELFDFIEVFGPDYWIYGHHHQNIADFNIAATKMMTNQLGYVQYAENRLFNREKLLIL